MTLFFFLLRGSKKIDFENRYQSVSYFRFTIMNEPLLLDTYNVIFNSEILKLCLYVLIKESGSLACEFFSLCITNRMVTSHINAFY